MIIITGVLTLGLFGRSLIISMRSMRLPIHEKKLFSSVSVGDCFILNGSHVGKRPEYCVIVGKRIEKNKPIIDYKLIAYDHFFKRYEEGDIVISCGVKEFFGYYRETEEDIDYFKYEKYS